MEILQEYWQFLLMIIPVVGGWYLKAKGHLETTRSKQKKEMENLITEISNTLQEVRLESLKTENEYYKLQRIIERIKAVCPECYKKIDQ